MKTKLEEELFKIYKPYLHGENKISDKVLTDFKKDIERVRVNKKNKQII